MLCFFQTFFTSRQFRRMLPLMLSLTAFAAISLGTTPRAWAQVPAAPTNVVATPVSPSQINLTWTASTRATSYNIKRGTVSGGPYSTAGTATTPSYSNTGLTPATRYYYVVTAVNSSGESANSAEVLRTTLCTPPTSLVAAGTPTQSSLTWTASAGATSYSLYRGTTKGGEGTTAYKTGLTGTSYADTSVTAGATYYYTLAAVNNGGTSASSNEAAATESLTPSGVVASGGDAQTLLVWRPVGGATGYNIYRSTSSGGEGTTPINGQPGAANAYLDEGLSAGTAYYYTVAAVFATGPQSAQSTEASTSTSLSTALQDSYWTIAQPSTSVFPAPTVNGIATSVSANIGPTLVASALVAGATTSQVNSTAEANCAGTWTFTWTGTSWPTLYVIQHLQLDQYQATVSAGTGTAQVSVTGGSILVSAAQPTSAPQVMSEPPPAFTFNVSDLTAPILATATTAHTAAPLASPASGWSEALTSNNTTQTAYTSAWFQAHFATPSAITLTFTVPTSDVTTTASLSNSTSTSLASANGNVSDVYSGL